MREMSLVIWRAGHTAHHRNSRKGFIGIPQRANQDIVSVEACLTLLWLILRQLWSYCIE